MSIDAKKTTSLVHVLESLAPHAMPDREILHGSERRLFDQALAELSWHLRDLVFFFFLRLTNEMDPCPDLPLRESPEI